LSSTGSSKCGKDSFCISGIRYNCPDGYYSLELGLADAKECIACPPGKICANYSVGIKDCEEGFYCAGGVFDRNGMKPCPVGNYCPAGTIVPLLCPLGTY